MANEKMWHFELPQERAKLFFPHERIKDKVKLLEILLEATRFISYIEPQENIECERKIILHIDKMSRLFFIEQKKFYSITFPFTAYIENQFLTFNYQGIIEVDSELISNLISIIKDPIFASKCSLDFADPIYLLENEYNDEFWVVLKGLLLSEDAYIRYDVDEEQYLVAKENGKEHTHPKNHYDIFYTSNGTFKLGLEEDLTENDFLDVLNTQSDCKYLTSPKIKK